MIEYTWINLLWPKCFSFCTHQILLPQDIPKRYGLVQRNCFLYPFHKVIENRRRIRGCQYRTVDIGHEGESWKYQFLMFLIYFITSLYNWIITVSNSIMILILSTVLACQIPNSERLMPLTKSKRQFWIWHDTSTTIVHVVEHISSR